MGMKMPSVKQTSVKGMGSSGMRLPSLGHKAPMPSSGAIRFATGGLGMSQVPLAQQLSAMTGTNITNPPENAALPTDQSKLQGFQNQIGRADIGKDSAAMELLRQQKAGEPLDFGKIAHAGAEGFKLNPQVAASGSDVVGAAIPGLANPSSFIGQFTKATLGTAFDIASSPLNLLHLGIPTKLGETFEQKGTGVIPGKPLMDAAGKPIPAQGFDAQGRLPLSDLGQPGTVGDQLIHGLRSAVRIGPLESPDFMNRMVGHTINHFGSILKALPLVGPVMKGFHEGKLNYLRPHFQTLDAINATLKDPNHPAVQKLQNYAKISQDAVKGVSSGKTVLDPLHDTRAQEMGHTTPEARVNHAVIRYLGQDQLPAQKGIIKDLNTQIATKSGIADGLAQVSQAKKQGLPMRVPAALTGKFLKYPEQQAGFSHEAFRNLSKQPPESIDGAVQRLRQDIQTHATVRDELQFKQDHPETFDPNIAKLGEIYKDVNEKDIIPSRTKTGATSLESGEFGAGRTLTPEAKAQFEKYQGGKPTGTGSGGRLWDQASFNQQRVLKEFTLDQAERLFANPLLRKQYFPAFGAGELTKEKSLLGLLGVKDKDPISLFNHDPLQDSWQRLLNSKKAVNSMDMIKQVKEQFGYDTPEKYYASAEKGETLEPPSIAKIPTQFQSKLGEQFFTTPEIAKEFNLHVAPTAETGGMQNIANQFGAATHLLQKMTLFGVPLYNVATANRNFFGHGFLSLLRGAFHPEAMAASSQIALARLGHEVANSRVGQVLGMPGAGKSWDEVKAGLPTKWGKQGLNLAQVADDIDKSGQMKAGQGMMNFDPNPPNNGIETLNRLADKIPFGPKFGQDLDNFMSHLIRTQHYIARLKQGWEGGPQGAAMRDVKDSMIDYSQRALSPMENKWKKLALFYSFMRFNYPLMFQAILNHPGRISATNMAMKNISGSFGQPAEGEKAPDERYLDNFINGNLHMRLFKDSNGNWNYFVLKNFLPLADLEDLMSGQGIAEKALSSLTPYIKMPAEQMTGKSFFFKNPDGSFQNLERFPGEQGEVMGMPVSKRAEVAIKEILRPVNALDQYNPENIFGVSKQVNQEGAYKGSTPMTSGESLASMLAFRPRAYDEQRATADAQFNFRNQFNAFREAAMRASNTGDTPNVLAAVRGIQGLLAQTQGEGK